MSRTKSLIKQKNIEIQYFLIYLAYFAAFTATVVAPPTVAPITGHNGAKYTATGGATGAIRTSTVQQTVTVATARPRKLKKPFVNESTFALVSAKAESVNPFNAITQVKITANTERNIFESAINKFSKIES